MWHLLSSWWLHHLLYFPPTARQWLMHCTNWTSYQLNVVFLAVADIFFCSWQFVDFVLHCSTHFHSSPSPASFRAPCITSLPKWIGLFTLVLISLLNRPNRVGIPYIAGGDEQYPSLYLWLINILFINKISRFILRTVVRQHFMFQLYSITSSVFALDRVYTFFIIFMIHASFMSSSVDV